MGSEAQDHGRGAACGRLPGASPAAGDEQLEGLHLERLRPRRSLRVLLVEHDDSTRHIVAALLRKCSYRVLAVADGLKAWETMREKNCIFDLVLTEVDIPSLSGIGLLTKIIGAEEYKNIPVIMMSTKDSVGIVLKCMLKGAADFLVKPVRKNELRNLWQHVWRKYSSGANACALEFNATSNHVSSNRVGFSQTGENSEERTDAQIHDHCLGRKRDAVLDDDQVQAEPIKIRCSSLKSKAHQGLPGNSMTTFASSSPSSSTETDAAGLPEEKNLEAGEFENLPIQTANAIDSTRHPLRTAASIRCQISLQQNTEQNIAGHIDPLSNGQVSCAAMEKSVLEENGSPKTVGFSEGKFASISSTLPILGLSSTRVLSSDGDQHQIKKNNILNHSSASAFSRYGSKDGNSACPASSSAMAYFRGSECIDESQSHDNHYCTNGGSNSFSYGRMTIESQQDLFAGTSGREDNVVHLSQFAFMPMPIHVGAIPSPSLHVGYGTLLKPMFYQGGYLRPRSSNAKGQFQVLDDDFSGQPRPVEYHCYDLNHPVCRGGDANQKEVVEQRDVPRNHAEQVVFHHAWRSGDIVEGCGINISGDTTEAAKAAATVLELGNGSIQNFSNKEANPNCSYREAALMKYQLKRKDRCFGKKIRYHNRKKLAEQRPRVKGQFVSQKT